VGGGGGMGGGGGGGGGGGSGKWFCLETLGLCVRKAVSDSLVHFRPTRTSWSSFSSDIAGSNSVVRK